MLTCEVPSHPRESSDHQTRAAQPSSVTSIDHPHLNAPYLDALASQIAAAWDNCVHAIGQLGLTSLDLTKGLGPDEIEKLSGQIGIWPELLGTLVELGSNNSRFMRASNILPINISTLEEISRLTHSEFQAGIKAKVIHRGTCSLDLAQWRVKSNLTNMPTSGGVPDDDNKKFVFHIHTNLNGAASIMDGIGLFAEHFNEFTVERVR